MLNSSKSHLRTFISGDFHSRQACSTMSLPTWGTVLPALNLFNLDGGWHFDNCSTRKIDDVLLKQGGLLHVLPLPVHLTIRILSWWVGAVSGWVGRVDGPKDFSVSPSPFGLGLAWRLRRDWGQYLTIIF